MFPLIVARRSHRPPAVAPETQAAQLLQQHGWTDHLSIPIVTLCDQAGLNVFTADFREPEIAAVLLQRHVVPVLYVDRSIQPFGQRWVMAHALGH